jgi:RNA polymerase sigma factor (sigma-70 family)
MEQDPRELLAANIALIRQLVQRTARHNRLTESERQDFESWMWIRLIDNDFHILRAFQGRASLGTYLRVVVQRSLLDFRTARWGKWRPSAHARRLGPKAVTLERLIVRDGVPAEVAAAQLSANVDALPPRRVAARRGFDVPVELATDIAAPQETSPDEGLLAAERRDTARAIARALARTLDSIPPADRRLLWLRYGARLTVAQIATRVGENQRSLYRKLTRLHAAIRSRLESAGLKWTQLAGVIGASDVSVHGVLTSPEIDNHPPHTTQRVSINASDRGWPLASCL